MAINEIVDRSAEAADDDHWVGAKPSIIQMTAVLFIGTMALIIAGVQPLLLGALVHEHRLSATALGWTVTLEFLTMGLGVGLAESLFPPSQLRRRGLIAAAVLFAANIVVIGQSELGIMAARAVAGLAEGVLGWIVSLMIARASTPARLNAIFLVAQGLAQILFAAILPLTLMKTLGANGGFYALGGTAIAAGGAALLIPDNMMALPEPEDEQGGLRKGRLSHKGLSSLAEVVLLYAFFIGFFAYLAQLAAQARLRPEQAGFAVAATLAASIIGSGLAAAFAKRLSYYAVYIVCLPINLMVLAALATLPDMQIFMVLSIIFGFFWGFFMPFQLPLVIEADPTRRAAVFVPGAMALGAAGGPLLCSFFVTNLDARGALAVSGACLLASFTIASFLHLQLVADRKRSVGA
ncbi:MAG: MFS transporter [Rhizomicrobium sp.]